MAFPTPTSTPPIIINDDDDTDDDDFLSFLDILNSTTTTTTTTPTTTTTTPSNIGGVVTEQTNLPPHDKEEELHSSNDKNKNNHDDDDNKDDDNKDDDNEEDVQTHDQKDDTYIKQDKEKEEDSTTAVDSELTNVKNIKSSRAPLGYYGQNDNTTNRNSRNSANNNRNSHNSANNNSPNDATSNTNNGKQHNRTHQIMDFAALLLFLTASILYLILAIDDYQWSKELLTYPEWLRPYGTTANDDEVWTNYKKEERYNASLLDELAELDGEVGLDGDSGAETAITSAATVAVVDTSRSGGVRRMGSARRTRMTRDYYHHHHHRGRGAASSSSSSSSTRTLARTLLGYLFVFEEETSGRGAGTTAVVEETFDDETPTRVSSSQRFERERSDFTRDAATSSKTTTPVPLSPTSSQQQQQEQQPPRNSRKARHRHGRHHRNLQTPEELYYDEDWSDLPPSIRNAYLILGYDEDIWCDDGTAETDDYDWDELDDVQKEAALFIGYTEAIWCADDDDDDDDDDQGNEVGEEPPPADTDSPTREPTTPSPVTDRPTEEPTSRPVTNDPTRRPTRKPTRRPTGRPTRAPTRSPITRNPTMEPTTRQPTSSPQVQIVYWESFTAQKKLSLELLGYTSTMWDGGIASPVEDKAWAELTSQEKYGAYFLGYRSDSWDGVVGDKFAFRPPMLDGDGDNGDGGNIFEGGENGGQGSVPTPPFLNFASPSQAPIRVVTTTTFPMSASPSLAPFPAQTSEPTPEPTPEPTVAAVPPTAEPTEEPTEGPSSEPSKRPTETPSPPPSSSPPTRSPTTATPTSASPIPAPVAQIIPPPTTPTPIAPSFSNTAPPATDPEEALVTTTSPPPPATPKELYYDEYWADLPPEIQAAYTVLGHGEALWNGGLEPETEYWDWDELTPEMQEAALSIGYTEEIWCETTMQPTGAPTSSYNPTDNPTDDGPEFPATAAGSTPEELYYDEFWADLPLEIQAAYGLLGSNETIWNEGLEAETDDWDWDELTPEMQEAALFIGYTEEIWCTTVQPTASPSDSTSDTSGVTSPVLTPSNSSSNNNGDVGNTEASVLAGYYDDYDWDELPPRIQDAATVLGYNQQLWDSDGTSWSDDEDWDDLSLEAQEAAALLGYDKYSWDGIDPATGNALPTDVPGSTLLPNEADEVANTGTTVPADYYDDYDWSELPPHIQDAATVLGYNQRLWDSDGTSWSDDEYWDDLPLEAQEAAALLGYDKYSWDGIDPITGAALKSSDDDFVSYDDDYLFQVGPADADVWVSQYQILYFFAALCFVIVGILDLIRERHSFHILMICAGLFGVIAAVYVEEDIRLSNILSAVSVHFFLLEALTLFGEHKRSAITVEAGGWVTSTIMYGDLSFALGALIDVILSYFYLLDSTADWDPYLMGAAIFAAVLWLLCAFIYMGAFIYEYNETERNVDTIEGVEDDGFDSTKNGRTSRTDIS